MGTDELWESPTTKSRFRVVASTEETKGERVKIAFENDPGDIGPPYHLHPRQDEEFAVVEGELVLRVDGVNHHLHAGETFLVPRGSAHTFWNPGKVPVRFTSEHRPALGFECFLKTIYDLDADGKSDAKGQPALLQLMAILKPRGGEEYLAGPPRLAQRVGSLVLGTIAWLFGFPSIYVSSKRAR